MMKKHPPFSNLIGHDGLKYYRDGDCIAIVHAKFTSLQSCTAVFLECPYCNSREILMPAEKYRRFTCDPCGQNFQPDLTELKRELAERQTIAVYP